MALNIYKLERSRKSIFLALQTYYGIGQRTATFICRTFGLKPSLLIQSLPKRKLKRIYKFMDRHMTVESELKILTEMDIQKLMQIKSFRGVRLEKGLPVRGQRARTNGNTQRRRPIKKIVAPT